MRGYSAIGLYCPKDIKNLGGVLRAAGKFATLAGAHGALWVHATLLFFSQRPAT